MKILLQTFLLITTSLLILTSCGKEFSSENGQTSFTPTTPPTLPTSSIRLTKFYEIDTTLSAPGDTVYRITITYNSSDKPLTRSELQTGINGDSGFYLLTKYEYNGSDSFAYRTTEYSKQFSSTPEIFRDTNYYTFSGGKSVKDSFRTADEISVYSYIYNPTFIKRTMTWLHQPFL